MVRLKTLAAIGCILLSALLCLYQFKLDYLLPLALGWVALIPVWWLQPSWWRWAICFPMLFGGALVFDAFIFHHRFAVEARAWQLIWDIDEIEDTLIAPSGHTTIYIVGSNWLDSSYRVYISTSRLFPYCAHVETAAADSSYPRDVTAKWNGPFFTAGDNLVSVAFDERSGKLYTYADWTCGSHSPTETSKTREIFDQYVRSLH